jgi:hypothetical protein
MALSCHLMGVLFERKPRLAVLAYRQGVSILMHWDSSAWTSEIKSDQAAWRRVAVLARGTLP